MAEQKFNSSARARGTHWQTVVMIMPYSPTNSKKAVIAKSKRNDSKSTLDICLDSKTATASSFDGTNGIFNCSVSYTGKIHCAVKIRT